jgi:hypothetical protein
MTSVAGGMSESLANVDDGKARSYAAKRYRRDDEGARAGDAGRVTVSEFTFLALGLVLGVASGVALACHGCVAGVFAQGAGLPSGMVRAPAFDFAWFNSPYVS